jgi:hypothetical protein
MIPSETSKKIRDWFFGLTDKRPIKSLSFENQYNVRNMLDGFLQACEIFGYITPEEANTLFKELAE